MAVDEVLPVIAHGHDDAAETLGAIIPDFCGELSGERRRTIPVKLPRLTTLRHAGIEPLSCDILKPLQAKPSFEV